MWHISAGLSQADAGRCNIFFLNVVCDRVSMRNAEVILKAVKFSYKHVCYDNLSTEAIFI